MSGTTQPNTATLTEAERVSVRRFCGYPALGNLADGNNGVLWFFVEYRTLEHRMTHMAPAGLGELRAILAECVRLERELLTSSENLDTDQAAVWKRNPREWSDRTRALRDWRRTLCDFIGIPPGPGLNGGAGRIVI